VNIRATGDTCGTGIITVMITGFKKKIRLVEEFMKISIGENAI